MIFTSSRRKPWSRSRSASSRMREPTHQLESSAVFGKTKLLTDPSEPLRDPGILNKIQQSSRRSNEYIRTIA